MFLKFHFYILRLEWSEDLGPLHEAVVHEMLQNLKHDLDVTFQNWSSKLDLDPIDGCFFDTVQNVLRL